MNDETQNPNVTKLLDDLKHKDWKMMGDLQRQCIEIRPPGHIVHTLSVLAAREFATAIIRECDHLEGIK